MNNMYIRTKDNIYEITDKQYDVLCGNLTKEEKEYFKNITSFGLGSIEEGTYKSVLIRDILNYSENMVELYDEFVCEWFDKKVNRYRHVYCSFKIGQSKELYRRDVPLPPDVDFEIYAGIWIKGKGLTYVAKMNKEGDLDPICI